MKQRIVRLAASAVLVLSFALTACQPAAAPTVAPTAQPTAAAAFTPLKLAASDCSYGGEFKSIEAVDEYTVKFSLCQPDPAFASKIPIPAFEIYDKDYLDANLGDVIKMSEKPNGTGPYMLQEWVRGDHVTLTANPNYWGTAAKIKTVIFRWSEQPSQRLLELQSGNVDGIDNPAPEDFTTIKNDSNLALYPRNGLNTGYLGLNNTIKPFDNVKVRQALAMAIDRQRIVDQFYPAGSLVAEQVTSQLYKPGYTEGLKWYDYNPEEAKKLLAEAGYPDGFETNLSYRSVVRTYLPLPDKVAQEIQAQLAKIGVKVNLNPMESTTFLDSAASGKEGMYLLGGNSDYPDAADVFNYNFGDPNKKSFGTLYQDIYDEVIAASKITDAAARQAHYDKANQLIKDHVPYIPLAHGTSATAFKAEVKDAHASPLNKESFAVMDNGKEQLVWMQGAEPSALSCLDTTDDETSRACYQIYETLVTFKPGTTEIIPVLAEKWTSTPDATEWTFNLRQGVKFQNGATLDANDVVATFIAQWDASSPNHTGQTKTFEYFNALFGQFLNAK